MLSKSVKARLKNKPFANSNESAVSLLNESSGKQVRERAGTKRARGN